MSLVAFGLAQLPARFHVCKTHTLSPASGGTLLEAGFVSLEPGSLRPRAGSRGSFHAPPHRNPMSL